MVAIGRNPDRQLVFNDRNIDETFGAEAGGSLLRRGRPQGETSLEFGQIGFVGDIADRAAHRARPEQRALRPGQDFDPLEIGRVNVKVTARGRGRRIVQVERDVGLDACDAKNLRTRSVGRKAANIDRRDAGAARRGSHRGQVFNQLFEIGDVELRQLFTAKRLDRDRNAVCGFVAAGRSHDNVDNAAGIFLGRGVLGQGGARTSAEHGNRKCCARQLQRAFHSSPSLVFQKLKADPDSWRPDSCRWQAVPLPHPEQLMFFCQLVKCLFSMPLQSKAIAITVYAGSNQTCLCWQQAIDPKPGRS